MQQRRFNYSEIANVMYISSLEVLARHYLVKEDKVCEKCKQKEYKIAKRVRDVTHKILRSDYLVQVVKDNYSIRSQFLHEGNYFSNSYLQKKYYTPSLDIGQGYFDDDPWIDINNQNSIRNIPVSIIRRRLNHLTKK